MSPTWQETAAAKVLARDACIPVSYLIPAAQLPAASVTNVRGIAKSHLSAREFELTEEDDVDVILAKLASSTWSSVELTAAYCKRATIAQQLTNCLTEVFFDSAMKRAAELDAILKSTGKTVGPLHGMVISLKDQVSIKGMDNDVSDQDY